MCMSVRACACMCEVNMATNDSKKADQRAVENSIYPERKDTEEQKEVKPHILYKYVRVWEKMWVASVKEKGNVLLENDGNGSEENELALVSILWWAGKCLFVKRYWVNCAGNGHIQKLVYLCTYISIYICVRLYAFFVANLQNWTSTCINMKSKHDKCKANIR